MLLVAEDADLRASLCTLGPAARADLERLARDDPAGFYRALGHRPDLADLTHLLSVNDTPETARLRVLRAFRDIRDDG